MASSVGSSAINLNRVAPVIDFTSLDFASIVEDLTSYAQANFSDRWTDFNRDQFAVVFRDLIGYCHDMMTFYLNACLRRISVQTAVRRQHIVDLGKTYDYRLRSASQASGLASIVVQGASLPLNLSEHAQFSIGDIYFQPVQDYVLTVANATSGPDGQGNYTFGGVSSPPLSIVLVEGQEYQNQLLGVSDATREQSFSLTYSPLIDGTLTVLVNGIEWTEVQSFVTYGSSSQVYRVETDDNDVTTVFFGDGANGKIPANTHTIIATYKVGGGRRGRVGTNTALTVVSSIPGIVSAALPNGSTGGEDKETLNHARAAIPASLSQGDRAVTERDYAITAAKASPNVAKAMARVLETKLVQIVIAPPGGGFATDILKSEVLQYVNARRMVGRRAIAGDPVYVDVAVGIDCYVNSSVQRDVLASFVKSMFLTTVPTAPQVGILDFDNVGFAARDENDDPQLTTERVYNLLRGLKTRGVQRSDVVRFDTVPSARPISALIHGNGTFAFTTVNAQDRRRRQWRVVFTGPTTYAVYERITGEVTSLSPLVLTDDRQVLSSLPGAGQGATLNPNARQGTTFAVSSYPAATQVAIATGSLFTAASKGDPYYIEWPASPATGTVGVAYSPVDVLTSQTQGISWTFTAGTQAWAAGNSYLISAFQTVDNIILADDEIPRLLPQNLVVNVKSAI